MYKSIIRDSFDTFNTLNILYIFYNIDSVHFCVFTICKNRKYENSKDIRPSNLMILMRLDKIFKLISTENEKKFSLLKIPSDVFTQVNFPFTVE